ncbi:MAG TPA: hypothetical protein V6D17_21515 [Candidatus Obscuribacterales bacterium]
MRRRWVQAVCLLLLTGCSTWPLGDTLDANPDPWPKPYQATFSVPAGTTVMEQRQYSDGKGRIRLDVPFMESRRSINVYDLKKNEKLSWTEGTGEYLRETLNRDEVPFLSKEKLQSQSTPSLGDKVIDGHPCVGFGGPQGEIWIDPRYGIAVLSTSGGASIKLTSFRETAPSDSLFEVPAGYRQMANGP